MASAPPDEVPVDGSSGFAILSVLGLGTWDNPVGIVVATGTEGVLAAVVEYEGGGGSGRSKTELSNAGGEFSNIDFGILKGLIFGGSSST